MKETYQFFGVWGPTGEDLYVRTAADASNERADADTAGVKVWRAENVGEILDEQNRIACGSCGLTEAESKAIAEHFAVCEDGGKCGAGGYCEKCPLAAGASERADAEKEAEIAELRRMVAGQESYVSWHEAQCEKLSMEKEAALTDDQIREIWLRETGFDEQAAPFAIIEFARAILAASRGD